MIAKMMPTFLAFERDNRSAFGKNQALETTKEIA